MTAPTYEEQLKAEIGTWCIPNPDERLEKLTRERMRAPKLIRDLLLDKLPTHMYDICEVGGGPEPISDLLPFKSRVVYDPCSDQYREFFPCADHISIEFEEVRHVSDFDLVICTNALDHVRSPRAVVSNMVRALSPGGYMALMCAENNALTNPHPCHEHNLTAEIIHQWVDDDFETVWELTYAKDNYRYGWVKWEGKRGQPAFALLLRKCVGYG